MRRHRPANTHDFPILQESEQLGLGVHGQLGDLIQEQRAAVRQLEQAGLPFGLRARKGSLFIAEELRFDERVGHSGAVDPNEGPPSPRGLFMDEFGDDAFSSPRFAGKQDGRVGAGNPDGHVHHPLHLPAAKDQSGEVDSLELRIRGCRGGLHGQRLHFQHFRPQGIQLLEVSFVRDDKGHLSRLVENRIARAEQSFPRPIPLNDRHRSLGPDDLEGEDPVDAPLRDQVLQVPADELIAPGAIHPFRGPVVPNDGALAIRDRNPIEGRVDDRIQPRLGFLEQIELLHCAAGVRDLLKDADHADDLSVGPNRIDVGEENRVWGDEFLSADRVSGLETREELPARVREDLRDVPIAGAMGSDPEYSFSGAVAIDDRARQVDRQNAVLDGIE